MLETIQGGTLDGPNNGPPEPETGGSIVENPINLSHLLDVMHVVDLIC
jgi:hypothetical protein